MKKIFICILGTALILAGCGSAKQEAELTEKEAVSPAEQTQQHTSNNDWTAEFTTLWDETDESSLQEKNALSFKNGLQIIFPEEWKGKVKTFESSYENIYSMYDICETNNADAGVGGLLLCLEYVQRGSSSAENPYCIFQMDTVLGVYNLNGEQYALILELPREMNYVEGDEQMRKYYEDLYTFIDEVEFVTEDMQGFIECGIEDIDWIEYL